MSTAFNPQKSGQNQSTATYVNPVFKSDDSIEGADEELIESETETKPDLSTMRTNNSTPQFGYSVVVAIDFGTTYSGYAYSFTHDPENIHIMRKWEGK